MREADVVRLRDQAEQVPIAVKAPRAPLHGDFEAWLIVAVEQLVGHLPRRVFVGESLNLSYFVARKIWRRRNVSPCRCRAHRLQRCEPRRWLLVLLDTTFDLLQTAIN